MIHLENMGKSGHLSTMSQLHRLYAFLLYYRDIIYLSLNPQVGLSIVAIDYHSASILVDYQQVEEVTQTCSRLLTYLIKLE